MSKNSHNTDNGTFGLDIVSATNLLKSEQYGAWYRDPWNFPELDANFTKTLDASTLGIGKTSSGINFTSPPSFLPFDFPKSFFATRPAVTQDLQSSLAFAAAALQVAPSLHESLEDWVYGWRMRNGKFAGQSSNEWTQYTGTKKDILQSEYSAQTDITSCFASIDHKEVSDFVYKTVGKTTAANIINSVLEQHATTPGRRGLPQRSNAASILAQLAFYYIDLRISERLFTGRITSARRWMDDISFEGSYEELHDLLTVIQNDARRFGLEINTSKTSIITSTQLVQEIEEEENKLIEVEPVIVDAGYDEPPLIFYDDSFLVDLESEILANPSRFSRPTIGRLFRGVYGGLGVRCVEWVTARWSERIRLLHETSQERAVMGKGITGLDRTQLSCLVEMVLGDTEISLAPRILGPLAAVRATLMYLRTNTSQEAIAEIMGVSQPTISRAISVVTRIIARVLGPVLATVEEVPHGGVHIIDGTLLPCWSWKDRTDLWSGKHKRTGLSLQVLVSPAGRLRWASDPLPGATHDTKAITTSGLLEEIDPSCCIADKGYIGTGVLTPYKKPPNSELTKAQKQANKSLNEIRYVVERTIAHIKSWKILAHDYRRPLHTFKETITATLALYAYTNP